VAVQYLFYIYALDRHFYPKKLNSILHSRYIWSVCILGIKPMTLLE